MPYEMPYFANPEDESWRVISIYSQLLPSLNLADDQDLEHLMEQFDGRYTTVARDEEDQIVAVSSHYFPKGEDFLFLSGLAVRRDRQRVSGVGRRMIDHLSQVATAEGRTAIECNAIDTAVGFYRSVGGTALNIHGLNRFRIEL